MKEILDHFFHRHTFDPTKWEVAGSVEEYEDSTAFDDWYYSSGKFQPQERKVVGIRKTYTNTCLTCGTLLTKQVEL